VASRSWPPNIGAARRPRSDRSPNCVGCHSASSNLCRRLPVSLRPILLAVSGLAPGHAAVSSQTSQSFHSAAPAGVNLCLGTHRQGAAGCGRSDGGNRTTCDGMAIARPATAPLLPLGVVQDRTTPVLERPARAVSQSDLDLPRDQTNRCGFGATTSRRPLTTSRRMPGRSAAAATRPHFVTGGFKRPLARDEREPAIRMFRPTCNSCHGTIRPL